MHDDDTKYMAMFVGAFAGVFFTGLLISAFKGVYDFFAGAFNSIGAMFSGFIYMLWNIGLVAVIIAIAVSVVLGIWSFAQSFKKQMDDNADLRRWVKSEVEGSHKLWNLELGAKLKESADIVRALDAKVEAALKKPEVVPEEVVTATDNDDLLEKVAALQAASKRAQGVNETATNDVTMSNPF